MKDRTPEPACLAIIEAGVRGIVEEQFANIIWLSLILRRMRLPLDILLCRDAAQFALIRPAPASTLMIAGTSVATPRYEADIERLQAAGARVYVVVEDLGPEIDAGRALVSGVVPIDRDAAASLIAGARKAWYW